MTSTQAIAKLATSPIFYGRSGKLLANNVGMVIKNTFNRNVNDLQSLRFNALMMSGAILVASRIVVANTTAARTRGTPEGPYRYQEAVKTTFREILAWFLTYVILLYSQRVVADVFRNMLWAKGGVPWRPSFLNPFFQNLFSVPKHIREVVAKQNPKSTNPFSSIFGHIKDFALGRQTKEGQVAIQTLLEEMKREKIEVDFVNRKSQLEATKWFLDNFVIRFFARKNPDAVPMAEKINYLFNWAPPILGSVPSILLSGYFSESITQKYAEKAAAFISKKRVQRMKDMEQAKLDKMGVVSFSHQQQRPQPLQPMQAIIPPQWQPYALAPNPFWQQQPKRPQYF